MNFLIIILMAMFLTGCGEATSAEDPEEMQTDVENADIVDDNGEEVFDEGVFPIVASGNQIVSITCTSSDGMNSISFEERQGPLDCSHPNGIGSICSCEFAVVGGSVLGYSTNEGSPWCEQLTDRVLNGEALVFSSGNVYDSHVEMDCALTN